MPQTRMWAIPGAAWDMVNCVFSLCADCEERKEDPGGYLSTRA